MEVKGFLEKINFFTAKSQAITNINGIFELYGKSLKTIMTQLFLKWLKELIASGNVHRFYLTAEWKEKSAEVLKLDRNECQIHKERGHFRRAELVHHEKHVKRFPELALDIYYTAADGQRRRNLRSVCKWCHENVCHPERLKKKSKPYFTTEERWD